jgi:YD repeat-containing protein
MLGPGFYVPMFEARNVLIREQMMRAFLPCGKGLYLRRDLVDQNKFRTVDLVWTGYLIGDGDFVVWRDDGWKILYHKSRLASITTDEGHTFTWSYDINNLPTGVSEDGKSLVSVEPNSEGQIASFVFNSRRYEIQYGQRPITQVLLGQVTIKELDLALAAFKYPDGKADDFKFELTPDRIPRLAFTSKEGQTTHYSWDAATEHLATENGPKGSWNYKIGANTLEFGQPTVARINADGRSEKVVVDNVTGTTTTTALDGEVTVRAVFKTPGPLYDKVRQITDTVGKNTVLLRYGYDDTGRLIRKIDADGFVTIFTYSLDGKKAQQKVLPPSDSVTLNILRGREKVLLAAISSAKTPDDRDRTIQELALFYIHKMGNIDKAVGLIPSLVHPAWAYEIRVHAILGDRNLSATQRAQHLQALVSDYPQEKYELSSLIAIYQEKRS